MCGIFAVLSAHLGTLSDVERTKLLAKFRDHHQNLTMRGPESSRELDPCEEVLFAFYRLIINGLSSGGMQPFHLEQFPHLYVMCNGEIYNHELLESEIGYKNVSGSDCEVIVPMVARFGFPQTLKCLDGVFAIAVWDDKEKKLWLGRDPLGVRPLFLAIEKNATRNIVSVQAASEMKSLMLESVSGKNNSPFAQPFTPGTFICYRFNPDNRQIIKDIEDRYFMPSWTQNCQMTLPEALQGIKRMFRQSVVKRLMSERPIGCLLSGGLDSSLVAAIVAQESAKIGRKINTFSVGLEGSTDLKFARMVADHIGSIHHEFLLTNDEFLEAIDYVIWLIESWDTTTIRASVGNYLVCKKIADYNKTQEKFEDKVIVIFNGDGADELMGGYLYHHRKAPTKLDFHLESERLLTEIYCFDVLRSDRTISNNGLEARTPFLDKHFVGFFMSIPIDIRFNRDVCEKWLIREAFRSDNLLPEPVLNRKKEAFSDGVSGTERSWWQIIQDYIIQQQGLAKLSLTDTRFCSDPQTVPQSLEAAYYRDKFMKIYLGQERVIPHYWLPKWSGKVINPSARVLDVYDKEAQNSKA